MARGQQDPPAIHGLHLHGRSLHLHLGTRLLRLRNTRQRQAPRLRERPVVGLDERHDRRRRNIRRHGHRQGHHHPAAHAGDDDVPDLHHLYITGIHAQKGSDQ